ncbi:kinase-like domain-containing protein [Suillus americanus]|nr:kinase-like domain-containing protein [Suillus americanus]
MTLCRSQSTNGAPDRTMGTFTWPIEIFVLSHFCLRYSVDVPLSTRQINPVLDIGYTGHFFHVDFGYILGRDPKPFPPPVKVSTEMVDSMDGAQSTHYARFKNYCFTAFTILRKSVNLILTLVALMVDANIPDVKHHDVHEQIQEKFRLDLTEEAIKHFEALSMNETSYFTVVLDRIHDLAQYWRSRAGEW